MKKESEIESKLEEQYDRKSSGILTTIQPMREVKATKTDQEHSVLVSKVNGTLMRVLRWTRKVETKVNWEQRYDGTKNE